MSWQDLTIAFADVTFVIALLPSVFSRHKPALATSLLTAAGLAAITVAEAAFRLPYAATVTGVECALWSVLGWQARAAR